MDIRNDLSNRKMVHKVFFQYFYMEPGLQAEHDINYIQFVRTQVVEIVFFHHLARLQIKVVQNDCFYLFRDIMHGC